MAKHPRAAIEKFVGQIRAVNEYDYGDFMRKANSYIMDLQNSLEPLANKVIRRKISEMRDYIQFQPEWKVESTRRRIIDDAYYIEKLLSGQRPEAASLA